MALSHSLSLLFMGLQFKQQAQTLDNVPWRRMDGGQYVARLQSDDQIEVLRQPLIALYLHGHATDDQIGHASLID